MKTNQRSDILKSRGFSLVEVTIAMAIAAVSIVTILGMIPQGMQTMRDAGDQAIMGRIHQGILSEIQLTPFGKGTGTELIDSFNGQQRFYDDQGERLMPNERASLRHIYSARIHIPQTGGVLPQSVGGSGYAGLKMGGAAANPNLRTVIVEVAAVGGRDSQASPFNWDDQRNRAIIRTYQTMVVKTGQDFSSGN